MRFGLRTALFTVCVLLVHAGCAGTTRNFTRCDGPRLIGSNAPERTDVPSEIRVVTFNIRFAERGDDAIHTLSEHGCLSGADIVLLQEVDDVIVQRISRMLGFNYVYYPASVHSKTDRLFGNAVLAPWPLSRAHKFVLPGVNPKTKQIRIAVGALVTIGPHRIYAYSAHTETPWLSSRMSWESRRLQMETVASRADEAAKRDAVSMVIAGGDFNTAGCRSITGLAEMFQRHGFADATKGVTGTAKMPLLADFTFDFVFVKGLAPSTAGKHFSPASDHAAVCAVLEWPPD